MIVRLGASIVTNANGKERVSYIALLPLAGCFVFVLAWLVRRGH
jgi:hypothetical protein